MDLHFNPITGRTSEITDAVMSTPEVPQDDALRFKVNLCAEEIVANIVNYAYKDGVGYIDIHTELSDGDLVLVFKDSGIPFNPLESASPDISLPAADREIGGLGIFLCRKMMDSVEYEYVDGSNVLTMKIKVY